VIEIFFPIRRTAVHGVVKENSDVFNQLELGKIG
jgi:hypothetical protein